MSSLVVLETNQCRRVTAEFALGSGAPFSSWVTRSLFGFVDLECFTIWTRGTPPVSLKLTSEEEGRGESDREETGDMRAKL